MHCITRLPRPILGSLSRHNCRTSLLHYAPTYPTQFGSLPPLRQTRFASRPAPSDPYNKTRIVEDDYDEKEFSPGTVPSPAASVAGAESVKGGKDVNGAEVEFTQAEEPDVDATGLWSYEANSYEISRLPGGGYRYEETYPEEHHGHRSATALLQRYNSTHPACPPEFEAHYYAKIDNGSGEMWLFMSPHLIHSAFRPTNGDEEEFYFMESARVVSHETRRERIVKEIEDRKKEKAFFSEHTMSVDTYAALLGTAVSICIGAFFYLVMPFWDDDF